MQRENSEFNASGDIGTLPLRNRTTRPFFAKVGGRPPHHP
jgi:hypothetical protein